MEAFISCGDEKHLFIYSFDLNFRPYSRIFLLNYGGQHIIRRKQSRAWGIPHSSADW